MSESLRTTRALDRNFFEYFFPGNSSSNNRSDFDFSNLVRPEDVSVDAVVTSLYFNSIVFVVLMTSYECLRRLLPTVYSFRKKLDRTQPDRCESDVSSVKELSDETVSTLKRQDSLSTLPDDQPLDWIGPVFGVPWNKVRQSVGLDGYFFLRYIRMNVRITCVSTFWFFLILVPIYATGHNSSGNAQGWYHISASNLPAHGWRMWIPCIFAYLFTAFILFVIKQEYRHFLDVRQDFFAKGCAHVNPLHHYSLMIENIPPELRSDTALKDYFDNLFPGKVHSASVVLNLPDLEEAANRCMRTCRRLEKSIAYLHAKNKRPTHVVGQGRLTLCGVDVSPCDLRCMAENQKVLFLDDGRFAERPAKGTIVDSISYYTQELAFNSRTLFKMQERKSEIAESGNLSLQADNWYDQVARNFSEVANVILDDSLAENELYSPTNSPVITHNRKSVTQTSPSLYGSFGLLSSSYDDDQRRTRLVTEDQLEGEGSESFFPAPFSKSLYKNCFRRWLGKLGLDFLAAGIKSLNRQLDVALEGVVGSTMSSTGFVTFLDLTSTTCAASVPLSVKHKVLTAKVAPEPREIRWENAHVSEPVQLARERIVNFVLMLGVILWSFPLAAIQAFAKAKYLAQIPGLEWILTMHGGTLSRFVNGYLPVVALLGLIMLLPLVFEFLAINYEHRKTFSDVQASMMGRYFYYQVANVYVSVTAGSIYKSLAKIIDHPTSILLLLGESLPSMAGYFVALLVTKILAGLPMIFLRLGALSKMLFLKTLAREPMLTQRELDAVYRLENIQYGWEYPAMLLVVVIVFTYAVICPVILPFGLVYFTGALVVYKKQILYVYSPVYESGGAMFPQAVQRTLFGLVCGQMLLLGYISVRGCMYQPIFLVPLPVLTIVTMGYYNKTYAEPSGRLSLERAREYDMISAMQEEANGSPAISKKSQFRTDHGIESRRRRFDKCAYRQPVLTDLAAEPWTYRRGVNDEETMIVRERLRMVNNRISRVSAALRDETQNDYLVSSL